LRKSKHKKGPGNYARAFLFGGNSWNRTNDTSIFSAVLYQLSYVAKLFRRPFERLGSTKVRKDGNRAIGSAKKIKIHRQS
jgi:hypothetical protein